MRNTVNPLIAAKHYPPLLIVATISLFVTFTLVQDFLYASFHKSSFYLSESFLFTTFWWVFVPFLYGQYKLVSSRGNMKTFAMTLLILLPITVHLLAFPALVWIISRILFENTFWFWRTFRFGLSAHLYQLIFFYTVPVLLGQYLWKRTHLPEATSPPVDKPGPAYQNLFIVSEGSNRTTVMAGDIFYFSANPPYITIHHPKKDYLYSETLRALSDKLDPTEFVRVHKSAIVNIRFVSSYRSRLNGDYDLLMRNGASIRISRNYAAEFKRRFGQCPRVAT